MKEFFSQLNALGIVGLSICGICIALILFMVFWYEKPPIVTEKCQKDDDS